ncbi:hypothetical protein ACIQ6R_18155 [Streptomyces sp. NPDC096048]|uniref:hypothetical protein n=1 Tax=Streptomyces sp. NPDC096048 TaxID=3366072 RepID=UPI003823A50A
MTDYSDDYDDDQAGTGADMAADFDAFFGEEVGKGNRERQTLTLHGRTYTLPDSLPLMFTVGMERVQNSEDVADIRKVLTPIFGAAALDEWAEQGMTDRQFSIVLIYAGANMRSAGSLSMQGAADLYDRQAAAKAAGKAPAPNRAARRKKKTGKRGSSGKR